jgi:hypothetical protein
MLRTVGHRVKMHRVSPTVVNERGDVEIQDLMDVDRDNTQLYDAAPPTQPPTRKRKLLSFHTEKTID